MVALGRIDIGADGEAGPIRIISERDDAELEEFVILDDGAHAALMWNAAGRSELAFFDINDETMTSGPTLPAEMAGGLTATITGSRIAMTVSGAATPRDVWRLDVETKTFYSSVS